MNVLLKAYLCFKIELPGKTKSINGSMEYWFINKFASIEKDNMQNLLNFKTVERWWDWKEGLILFSCPLYARNAKVT